MKALCREIGVSHFSRSGVEKWNQTRGPFKARSKHGNYNSWLAAHGGLLRVLHLGRSRPRARREHGGAAAGLLPRSGRRVRRRTAGLRQLPRVRDPIGRVAAVPVPLAPSARGQPGRHVDARRHQQRRAHLDAALDRRTDGLGHRGPRDQHRDPLATQPRDRPPLAVGIHARRARGRRRPRHVHRLLHPAVALGAGRQRGVDQSLSASALAARPAPRDPLRAADGLLPGDGDHLDAGRHHRDDLPDRRYRRPDGVAAALADALLRRGRPPARPVLLESPAQRQPPRGQGLRRARRHVHLDAHGPDLRHLAVHGAASQPRRLQGHAEGELGQPRWRGRLSPSPPVGRADRAGVRRRRGSRQHQPVDVRVVGARADRLPAADRRSGVSRAGERWGRPALPTQR